MWRFPKNLAGTLRRRLYIQAEGPHVLKIYLTCITNAKYQFQDEDEIKYIERFKPTNLLPDFSSQFLPCGLDVHKRNQTMCFEMVMVVMVKPI